MKFSTIFCLMIVSLFINEQLLSQTLYSYTPRGNRPDLDCSQALSLIWHDEFDAPEFDFTTWELGRPASFPALVLPDCEEPNPRNLVLFESSNIIMNPTPSDNSSGYVTLRTRKGPVTLTGTIPEDPKEPGKDIGCGFNAGTSFEVTRDFSSATIQTREARFDLVGTEEVKIEARVRIPANIASTWPSFWLYRAKEIDIFEFFGTNRRFDITLHSEVINGKKAIFSGNDYSYPNPNDWHVFGLVWNKFGMKFFLDGNKIREDSGLYPLFINCGAWLTPGRYDFDRGWFDGFIDEQSIKLDNNGLRSPAWMTILFGSSVWSEEGMNNATYPIDFDIDWVRMYKRVAEDDVRNLCGVAIEEFPAFSHLCLNDELELSTNISTTRPNPTNIIWTVSPELQILNADNNGIKVRATGIPGTFGKITANISGDELCPTRSIVRQVAVGRPPIPKFERPEILQCNETAKIIVSAAPDMPHTFSPGTEFTWTAVGATLESNRGDHAIFTLKRNILGTFPSYITIRVVATNECGPSVYYRDIELDCDERRKFRVTPNPYNGNFTLKFEDFDETLFSQGSSVPVYIFNSNLELVKTIAQTSAEQAVALNVIANGTYYAFARVGETSFTTQFIIGNE